jgi:hypothetical protein
VIHSLSLSPNCVVLFHSKVTAKSSVFYRMVTTICFLMYATFSTYGSPLILCYANIYWFQIMNIDSSNVSKILQNFKWRLFFEPLVISEKLMYSATKRNYRFICSLKLFSFGFVYQILECRCLLHVKHLPGYASFYRSYWLTNVLLCWKYCINPSIVSEH